MKTYIKLLVLVFAINVVNAQEIRYVNAENGLVLRDQPNRGSNRIAKLEYGTQIEILERTNLKLDVMDNNEIISGEWVKIKTSNNNEPLKNGYVFNGFLTETELKKRFNINFEEFSVLFDNLGDSVLKQGDTISVTLDLGETIQDKTIKIKHHEDYQKIEIFQKHENSITIMDEGPHCDLTHWKHYYSSWVPLKQISEKNQFKTIAYSQDSWNKFVDFDVLELKRAVKEHCGDDWNNLISKDITPLNQLNVGVSISTIYFKIIFTDLDGDKAEKIIAFNIPMGC